MGGRLQPPQALGRVEASLGQPVPLGLLRPPLRRLLPVEGRLEGAVNSPIPSQVRGRRPVGLQSRPWVGHFCSRRAKAQSLQSAPGQPRTGALEPAQHRDSAGTSAVWNAESRCGWRELSAAGCPDSTQQRRPASPAPPCQLHEADSTGLHAGSQPAWGP